MKKPTQDNPPPPAPVHHRESQKRTTSKRNKGPSLRRRMRKFVASLGGWFAKPIRKVRAWMYHWGPGALIGGLLGRMVDLLKSIMRFEGQDYSVPQNDGQIVVRSWPARKVLANPLWWCVWFGLFAWRWLMSRPYLPMLLALPAILLVVGLLAASTAGARVSQGTESAQYRRMLQVALAEGDMRQARLAGDALVRLNPRSSEHRLRRAAIEEQAGNLELARTMMSELATEGRSEQAALWMANAVGKLEEFSSWSDEQKREYFKWLNAAVEIAPTNALPRRMLSDLQRSMGNIRGAYATLLPVANFDNDTTYIVCLLEKQLGLTEQARSRGQKLEKYYKDVVGENPHDVESRTRYAAILFLLDRPSDSVTLLRDGLLVANNPASATQLKGALTEAMVIESKKIAERDTSPRGLMKSLQRLKEAMAVDPNNSMLLEAIAQACLKAAESDDQQLMVLSEAIVQGVAPDAAHFILGTIAINAGEMEEGLQHLEIAVKNNPNLPGLLNNLAHAVANGETPDLERALRLSEAAVNGLPRHPYLRETRGQIYFRLKRYTEAIADLEYAMAAPELRPSIRKSLAIAYEEIGQPELAERQRQLLERGK